MGKASDVADSGVFLTYWRPARFAASRPAFEKLGLLWFPILITLDGKGAIQSIRMGDAAPERP